MSKFVTRKWIQVNDLSGGKYSVNKSIRFKTPMLRSDLCDYSDAYIVEKRRITVTSDDSANTRNKELTFKNNSRFRSCISKINNTYMDNAENLDKVMPIYNLLKYGDNYSMTLGSLWNYYRDKVDGNANKIVANYMTNNSKTTASRYFEYKSKLIGTTPANINP